MATYSHTFTYDIEVPEVDTTMSTKIALTCTSDELRQVNDYLARASEVVSRRGPFTGEFQGLEKIASRSLPFTKTSGMIAVERHRLEEVPGIINLLACICAAVPGVGMNGKIYQVNAYFGKRVSYDVTRSPHQRGFDVVQHWDAVRPGDTHVPDPKVTVSAGSSATKRGATGQAPVALRTPADVVSDFYAQRTAGKEKAYVAPKLRLVNDALQGEPDYVMPDNRFDPMALVWLLQTGSIDLRQMRYDSGRTWGIAFNDRTPEQAPIFQDSLQNVYGQAPFDVLAYLDADGFSVPREWVHQSLLEAGVLSKGDLDMGNLLMLLSEGLWSVCQDEEASYTVRCDDRLLNGVPDAPTLIARLLWMLRAYAGYRGPFDIEYKVVHEHALDEKLPPFEQACFGACGTTFATSLSVMDKPVPSLNGGEPEHPFDGGFSAYRGGGSLPQGDNGDFEGSLNDEALFVRLLLNLIESMPLTAEVVGGAFADSDGLERMRLLPGDVLTLASSWGCFGAAVGGDVVAIRAYDGDGACVGVLKEPADRHAIGPADFGWRELACVLPHITCVVRSLDKKADAVPAAVELTFDARGLSEKSIVRDARRLMRAPYLRRRRLSRGPLVASDVRSHMGVVHDAMGRPYVPDEPNPAPAGLEKPQGTRPQLCENVIAFAATDAEMAKVVNLMRVNALRPVAKIYGWYYDEDELERAAGAEEVFRVLRSDFAERLPYVFRHNPSASYYREKHLLTMERVGERLVLKIWFNTYDKPNNDDLSAFLKVLPVTSLSLARVYKRADKREAHVLVDTYSKGSNSFGQMRRKERVVSLEGLSKRYEELGNQPRQNLDAPQLAEWAMLDEALGNGAHRVFERQGLFGRDLETAGTGPRASRYVAANGKLDGFAVADLLADDVIFFEPEDIVWRMGAHVLKGLRVNRAAADRELGFVAHARDYAEGVADLFGKLENNELLRVRSDNLHHSLSEVLAGADLTGMTLMQLMSWGRSIWIVGNRDAELRESLVLRAGINAALLGEEGRERVYVIACDERLLRGVPGMYLLLSRLVDALRSYNGQQGPHVEVIVAYKSDAADTYLKDFKGKVSRTSCEPVHVEGSLARLMDDVKKHEGATADAVC